ncbi:hypothetical protein ACFSSA_07780 [Luteolibacter algae]|uniref:Uncharacterized protein n=1 Tax=Luteolibacter algae TaxID=454151 RepID=A0ABW5DAW6_9BACT
MKKLCLGFLCWMLIVPAFAGGSVDRGQIIELLKKNESLWKYLSATLDFDAAGSAVRLGRHWTEMGGARVAPYQIAVKAKGGKEFDLLLTVNCSQKFLNQDGEALEIGDGGPSEATETAVDVIEKVESVSLQPLEDQ